MPKISSRSFSGCGAPASFASADDGARACTLSNSAPTALVCANTLEQTEILATINDKPLLSSLTLSTGLELSGSVVRIKDGYYSGTATYATGTSMAAVDADASLAVEGDARDSSTFVINLPGAATAAGKLMRKALGGLKVAFVHNGDYGDGLSTSLQAGLAALAPDCDGVLVCLGDMPGISAALLDSLIAAFSPQNGRLIIVPTYRGKRGNPVLFSTRFAGDLASVKGDVGARHLIGANADAVHEVEANEAALLDVDTPEALAAARRKLESGELQTGKKHEGSHE